MTLRELIEELINRQSDAGLDAVVEVYDHEGFPQEVATVTVNRYPGHPPTVRLGQ